MRAIGAIFGLALATLLATPVIAQAAGPADPDTARWWALTSELSDDSMEGRDTGSPGYDRAAALVARRFEEAGLKPAGTGGGWFQTIGFDDWRVDEAHSSITLGATKLALNREVQVTLSPDTPAHVSALATFRGLCGPDDLDGVTGKLVVCYGRPAPARLNGFDRSAALRKAGAVGMLLIAAPGLASEPIRWPFAYSRDVAPAGERKASGTPFSAAYSIPMRCRG